ncbi:enolase N-terminal-like fold-containing protein, partial [Chloroflexota bacterium]
MKITDELISKMTFKVAVRDIRQGPFQTAVLTRSCGLASTPHDPGPHHDKSPVADAGLLLNKNARDLALLVKSSSPSEAAIGMATINSLTE